MTKRKVCVVLTARASYAKLKPVVSWLFSNPEIELQLICAGSALLDRYGSVVSVVRHDGFPVSEEVHLLVEGENLLTTTKSTGLGVIEFAGAFDRLKPDVVVVMADRYEVLAAAIAASYQNIPLAHIQGGEVSGNIDEKVRHAITKLADLHFPATQRAHDWLIRMGEQPGSVYLTGCPSVDLAQQVVDSPALDFDVYERYGGVGDRPKLDNGYFIVMQHPVTTNPHDSRAHVLETLHALVDVREAIMWFWPNADAGSDEVSKAIRAFRENNHPENMHFMKNMEPLDFLRFLNNSSGILGNSSAAIREASFLGVPAINLGTRQANRERGPNVLDVPHDRTAIADAIKRHFAGKTTRSSIYGRGDAGKRIADVLASVDLASTKQISYLDDA